MRVIKRIMFAFILNASWQSIATAYENGGYFVYRVEKGSLTGVDETEYLPLYHDLIGITFPVSGDADLMRALAPKYDPPMGPNTYLRKSYQKTEYGFIYVPRTVYDYLYYIFMVTQTPTEQMPDAITGATDAALYAGWLKHDLGSVYLGIINDKNVEFRHAHFNAWAIAWMMSRDKTFHGKLVGLTGGNVTRFDIDHLVAMVKDLTKLNKANKNPKLDAILEIAVRAENSDDKLTWLTRYVKDGGPKGMNYPTNLKDKTHPTADTYSMSFGSSIFAAALGSDQHASTYPHLDVPDTFITPISIADYRLGKGVAGVFYIPPFPAATQQHNGMQELWHPRTRIFLVKGASGPPNVSGIGDYTVFHYLGKPEDWSKVGFLLFNKGTPLEASAIIKLSTEVNDYIQHTSVIIVKK